MGLPSMELVVVPIPLGPKAEAYKKAEKALPDIVAVLTGIRQNSKISEGAK